MSSRDVAARGYIPRHSLRALREHLEVMPRSEAHRREDGIDEVIRHVLVEQVAHRVHEDSTGLFPRERKADPLRPQPKIEALLVRMSRNPSESLREGQGVAVLASGTDLAA